ncbi:methionyl-tRNA formyltransferase [Candidatus Uhrbacteria bacterium CG10_big_fil_rev_8_21_14_0_10_48_16]|uniref:Methionyl-tRNA formyltransferase n=1 Tax=Candidatus Uhrbacteria bacterium CG10_big_fil_rev_8_21_14_0_10_48_16 TaxID=1975038 RepID=A0A2M8LGA3_9BACT|nr:MAG: methionyl-tRNA formyltransferase [Candidatus Uhrbacteria bacterium CG10_big_fil_rev_8_21_14_0_10_48_16]
MKVVFFGTPQFSVPFLRELILDPDIDVVAVVTQPDKPAGRGEEITASPIKLLAYDALIPVFQPASLKADRHIQEKLQALNADFFVVVAYGKLIPKDILDLPTSGCINVHPSLLPRHRGPSPMQWAIAEGDASTGVAVMLLDEGMDTGPLLAIEHIDLDADETYESLVEKVHLIGPTLLSSTLKRYLAQEIVPLPQDESKATLTHLLTKEDGHVNWSETLAVIEQKSRAYRPWPGTWTYWERKKGVCLRIKLLALQPADFNADLPEGTVVIKDGRLFVDCKDGTLEILTLQLEGKPKMNADAFIQGYGDIHGAVLI